MWVATRAWMIGATLPAQGFSLQANTKVTEGSQHADRDA